MLDWIKGLIPEHLEIKFAPNLTINNIKINSNNTNAAARPVTIDGDTLILDDATKDGQELIDKVIEGLPAHLEHNDVVIEDTGLSSLESLEEDIKSGDYEKQLLRYKAMVPRKDLPILEVAIIIGIKYQKHQPVSMLKADVHTRHGVRGNMICNLFSSDYFETLIKPLYEMIGEGELALDEYLAIYEKIVTESPLAMFIGIGSTKPKIKKLLLEKIETNKRSDVGYLNIHGIGTKNKKLIEQLLEDDDVAGHFTEEPITELTGSAVRVTVFI